MHAPVTMHCKIFNESQRQYRLFKASHLMNLNVSVLDVCVFVRVDSFFFFRSSLFLVVALLALLYIIRFVKFFGPKFARQDKEMSIFHLKSKLDARLRMSEKCQPIHLVFGIYMKNGNRIHLQ